MVEELRLALHSRPQSESWMGYERYAQRLADMSGGRIKIKIVNSGTVGIDEWNMVLNQQSDIGRIFTLNMDPFPMHMVPALPYILPSSGDNLSIVNSLYDKFLYREWQDAKVLWLSLMSPWHLHTTRRSVNTLEDFQGLRIHASGLVAELVKVWGGVPVEQVDFVNTSREKSVQALYNVLKTGEVDGVISTWEVVKDFKLYEITQYHTSLNVIRDVNATVMNLKTWNSMPPDIQQIFETLNPWAQQEITIAQQAEADEARMICREQSHEMIELTPRSFSRWITSARTLSETILEKLDAKGLPATEMVNEINRMAAGIKQPD